MHRYLILVAALAASAAFAADAAKTDIEGRRKALNDLLTEQWDYTMETNPEYASILGDKRWNDNRATTRSQPFRRTSRRPRSS